MLRLFIFGLCYFFLILLSPAKVVAANTTITVRIIFFHIPYIINRLESSTLNVQGSDSSRLWHSAPVITFLS